MPARDPDGTAADGAWLRRAASVAGRFAGEVQGGVQDQHRRHRKGMADGVVAQVRAHGRADPTAGDVILNLRQAPHPTFTRKGDGLHTKLAITLKEALTGFRKEIEHLGGTRRRGRDQTSVVQTTRVRQSKSFASYVAGTKRLLEKSALYASIPEIPAQGRRPPHPRRSELLCFGALRYGSRLAQDIAYRLCPALASISHQSYVSSATSFNKLQQAPTSSNKRLFNKGLFNKPLSFPYGSLALAIISIIAGGRSR